MQLKNVFVGKDINNTSFMPVKPLFAGLCVK